MSEELAFEGLKVLDISQGVAAPYCGMLLAQNGADVIKAEPPAPGDWSRAMGKPYDDQSAASVILNRGKRSLAIDLAPVRVNAVSPGVILTAFHDRYSTQEQLDAALKTIPQGRFGSAEDCAGAYLFLASRMLSGFMIGQVLEVNGGQLMP